MGYDNELYGMNEKVNSLGELNRLGETLAQRWSDFPGRLIRGWESYNTVDFIRGIDDPYKRNLVAILMENAYQYYSRMDETTRSLAVGSYEKYIFPVIRMVFANLVAADLVSVQPLPGPTGLIFYYDVVAGTTKGKITKGTKLYSAKQGPYPTMHYTDELVEEEYLGASGSTNYTGTLSNVPVRPGTVKLTDGTLTVTDDGNGNLIGDVNGSGTNTIDYSTGAYNVTFSDTTSGDVTTTYEFVSEANQFIPEIDIQLTSAPVVTRPNKLRARWAVEAEQDLLALHGISAESDLVTIMTNLIAQEINTKIIRHLRQIAPNLSSPEGFDITPPPNVSYRDHKEILNDAFVRTSNVIFQRTQRVQASWLVVSTEVANIVETLAPHFVRQPSPPGVTGVRRIGKLGDWDVFKDPTFPSNEWLMGFKGGSFLDTGYVHAVYQGLVTTPTITLDDFISRKGMLCRTAQKVINENFYAVGRLTQSGYNPVSGPNTT
mgnify:CR=1 FL=1